MMRIWSSVIGSVVCLVLAAGPPAVLAQEGLQVTTSYPAVTVDPGATARFPLRITSDAAERVDLAVVEAPEGWEVSLRGGGSTIEAVFTGGDEPPEATVEVGVPEDAAAAEYPVVVEARAASGTQRLALDLRVEEVEEGAVSLTAEFPSLRGPSDVDYPFDLELTNDTNQEATFSLETQAPRGWRAEARPTGEERAATTVVDAGASSRIQVTVTPPVGAPAGVYPILVRATGGPEPVEAELAVEVTGTPSLELRTPDDRLNARVTVGSSATLALEVVNAGTAPLSEVQLSATPPQNWEVTFSPETLGTLEPGTTQAVQAVLTPADNAIAGDYAITVRANSPDADDQIELRTTVEASPLGGVLGLAVLAVVAVGLFAVFRRYGRR
jgi:uncharacterized membrane protein